jgi:hypothetical protein
MGTKILATNQFEMCGKESSSSKRIIRDMKNGTFDVRDIKN